ncbi:pentapeptide repeat-containing protein [Aliarcobacter cryaerophilus]|uniref:pentapeptide repeat-containing protein n=1 Tax=Aliarcobacter cryaerophilus TaxID=28198 RepID=UPI00082CF772|nr:pentapeptide repeat-containing protein [Aliarcobacter cryaerophilus]
MGIKEKIIEILSNVVPDALKMVDEKDFLKDLMNDNDEILSASSWGKLIQYLGKKYFEIDNNDEAYHFIIYSAYTSTLLEGANHLEYAINNLAVPSIKKLDFSHKEFDLDKFSENKLVKYYKKIYNKILMEQLNKNEIKLLEKYINNNLKHNYYKILDENPLLLTKYIKHLQSDIFKEKHKHYEKTIYEENISKEYTNIVLNDPKALTLKDLYIKPNFRVHKNCFYENDKKVKELTYGNTKFIDCSEDDIHKFILKTLDAQNDLGLDRKEINTIFISGFPGQGKSSFVKRFVYDVINGITPLEKDVVLIKLKDLKNNQSLKNENIEKVIKDNVPYKIEDLDSYIVILDGLDELYMKSGLKLEDIDEICGKLSELKATTIVTTRHHYANFDKLNESNVLVLELKELSLEQQVKWLDKYKKTYPDKKLSKEILEELYNKKINNNHITELINQPILLHMIAEMDIENIREFDKSKLYERFFDILIERNWEKTQHPLVGGMQKEKYKKLLRNMLQELAYKIFISDHEYMHKINFEELDSVKRLKSELVKVQNNSLQDGLKGVMIAFYFQEIQKNSKDKKEEIDENYAIEFLHKSLMEYMVAEYIFKEIKRFIGKDSYTEEYSINSNEEAINLIDKLFSNKFLSNEIVYNLVEIIKNQLLTDEKEELTKRLIFFLNYFLNKGFTKKCDDRNTLIVLMNNFYGYWTILSNLKKGIFDKLPRQSYIIYLIKMIKDLNHQARINLSENEFNNQILSHTNFENVNLDNCSFIDSKLEHVSFPSHNYTWLYNYNKIDFGRTKFYYQKFQKSIFNNSNLSSVILENTIIEECEFSSCSFHGNNFLNTDVIKSYFNNSKFSFVVMKDCKFTDISFERVSFEPSYDELTGNTRLCRFENVEFINCKFNNSTWVGVEFINTKFINCSEIEYLKKLSTFRNCEFIENEELESF